MLFIEAIAYAGLTLTGIRRLRSVSNRDTFGLGRRQIGLFLAVIGILGPHPFLVLGAAPVQEVSGFKQFYSLPRDQALQHLPVRIQGTVVCYDAGWNQLYIHDGKETSWINPVNLKTELYPGQSVEIIAETTFSQGYPAWTNLQVSVLGEVPLPKPKRVGLSELASEFGQWIETTGQVRVAETSSGRLCLMVCDAGVDCRVYVLGRPGTNSYRQLVGSRVRFSGINASKSIQGHLESASIMVPNVANIMMVERRSADWLNTGVVAIDALLDRELGPWTNQPVHINGLISAYEPGDYILVKDPTGVIRARVCQLTRAGLDERIDLWGFLSVSGDEPILADAFFELSKPALAEGPVASPAIQGSRLANAVEILTDISHVLKLERAEAARALSVRVRGVVTYADPEWHAGFVQNSNSAIFFDLSQAEARAGDWIELTGQTDAGGYAPEIVNSSVRVLYSTNAPQPTKVDLDDLANGRLDSHWVELEGVVRRVNYEWGHMFLSLMSAKGGFKAIMVESADKKDSANLVNALVRVRGACSSDINERHQLMGFTLHVPGADRIEVLEPASADPFSIRAILTRDVARFDPAAVAGRRIKVSGVVTLKLPGQGFFLQDDSGGIRVHRFQTNEIRLGDLVDVLGFAAIGDFSPCIDEAIFRQRGAGSLPLAKRTTAESILARGENDGTRVQLEAQLLQSVRRSAQPKLVLQNGPIIFTAKVMGEKTTSQLAELPPGSLLRVTGVCSVQSGERHQAEAFRLLLGRASDVEFLKGPPLWTSRHALALGGIMGVVVLAALAWVFSLRRQVRRQTAAIHKEKNLLATLIDHLPDNVYVKDPQGRYVLTNLAHTRFHGAPSPGYFRGKSGFDLFPRERAQAYADADAKILTGGAQVFTCEEEVTNGEGNSRCLATTKVPLEDQAGKIIGLVGFSRDVTETKRAERELEEKQRVLSTLMSNLPGLAYRCRNDQKWTMEFLSEGCLELTGYAPAELVANHRASYEQVVHPEDRQRVREDVQRALQERKRFQLLYRIVTKGGVEKWVWEQGMGIFSGDGQLEALEGFVADVTERRRADMAVRDSEARFRAIWEHSIDGMRLTDSEGTIVAVNEAFCRLVKLPRERLVGKPFSLACHGELSSGSLDSYHESFRAGKVASRNTARVELWNGEQKDLEISSCFVELGQQSRAVLAILRDVSERRRVESVLAYERDLLGTLFENLPDALYFKDLESRFIRVSKSKLESSWAMALARHRSNESREAPPAGPQRQALESSTTTSTPAHLATREAFAEYIIGKTDFNFFDEARARSAFEDEQEIIRSGQPLIGKVERTNHLDGRVTWSLSTKMPWRDKDGRLIGTFGVSKDITPIKDAEANLETVHKQLLDASRQAGMAEVATGVLHNVGNVLNSLNVSATLLSEKLHQSRASGLAKVVVLLREHSSHLADFMTRDPRGRQLPLYLEQLAERLAGEQALLLNEVGCLSRNVEHIKNIVAMQQTYAKPAGITESVQAVELVEDALRINGGALLRHHVQIVREYEPHLPTLTIDKHKVLQILVNLVSNAGHACAQAGRGDKRLIVRLGDDHDHIRFSIADNGIGIAPENLTRIFSLGFTTRSDGHGFGLHSGALAAKELGGTLSSHSDGPDLGATFILELPVAQKS
jgi:PAS domain S-box-containing protein